MTGLEHWYVASNLVVVSGADELLKSLHELILEK